MSIFHTVNATCPKCGSKIELSRVASVNALRRPDLREAILNRSFQAETCPDCGAALRLPPHLTYMDMKSGDWILVEDPAELANWSSHEAEATAMFDEMFGPGASPTARDIAGDAEPRLVFGWPALREKIICTELGLDDVTTELLKTAVLRTVPGARIGAVSLRLTGGDAQALTLELVDDTTEESSAAVDVPRAVYDDIAADTAAWAPLRARLTGHPLVDLVRFTLEGAP